MNKSDNLFKNPLGDHFILERYPAHDRLRAWDAADELILEELANYSELHRKKILVINDSFGALSSTLQGPLTDSYIDSYVSFKAINKISDGITIFNDLEKIRSPYDLVIIKIPKNLSFFEDILATLSTILELNTPIIFGGMLKYLTTNFFHLIHQYIGETQTGLAKKKSRLIFSSFHNGKTLSPYPESLRIEDWAKKIINHSNVFSTKKLDIGTRFFLGHIPKGHYDKIVDLGCGNGIIGLQAKRQNPSSKIFFFDDSQMAIKSARENYNNFFSDHAQFRWTNCLEGSEELKASLVLCNPPFHQNNTIGDHISRQMFNDSRDALKENGQMRVIGNNHLSYPQKLKEIFGNSKVVTRNSRFTIVDAFKKS